MPPCVHSSLLTLTSVKRLVAVEKLQSDPQGVSGYGPTQGLPALRDALKAKLRDKNGLHGVGAPLAAARMAHFHAQPQPADSGLGQRAQRVHGSQGHASTTYHTQWPASRPGTLGHAQRGVSARQGVKPLADPDPVGPVHWSWSAARAQAHGGGEGLWGC
ncbi:hypothetical protein HaLaN_25672 [Haematococcus lacustris]|uniref:Uncharacterized protein n=1 Tax=Haematococcus lacustris TaxID=44745 RepID=A0A699ZYZ4_HAELA|nr:hypothetical protein HaLaN_25672 [Haematococcus lacustris]